MDRRTFIKDSVTVAGLATLAACGAETEKKTASGVPETGDMTYRVNPNNDDKVSLLGYGCMRWPSAIGDSGVMEPDQDQVNNLVDKAIESGVNYFDTAPVYLGGRSERVTGNVLKRYPRDSYFIATKMSNFSKWDFASSVELYEHSFSELQTDYIDYYLLHSINANLNEIQGRFIDNGLLDFLAGERAKGRIRNLGFSFHGNVETFTYMMSLHEKYHWDFVQIQMNYVDWHREGEEVNADYPDARYLYDELDSRGIPVVIMEPLLGGRLASVPEHIAQEMATREPYRSIASWAFRFCGSHHRVLTVLSGMTYMEHLEDNLKSFRPLVPLADEDMDFLDEMSVLLAKYPLVPCTGCAYCMPCPYGLDIPGIFATYNKCVNEGTLAVSGTPEYRRNRRKFLAAYSRAVLPERQADKCIACGQCQPKCPQRIRVPRNMQMIDSYVEQLKTE